MTETLGHGYSSESTQRELSNECQHDRFQMVFRKLCILVLWSKVASGLEGLKVINSFMPGDICANVVITYDTFDNYYEIKYKFTKYVKESLVLTITISSSIFLKMLWSLRYY